MKLKALTVQQLINKLQLVENKALPVIMMMDSPESGTSGECAQVTIMPPEGLWPSGWLLLNPQVRGHNYTNRFVITKMRDDAEKQNKVFTGKIDPKTL